MLLLSILPLGLTGYGEVRPAFPLMAVYYWAIYRPYMLTSVATFCTGLLLDLPDGRAGGAAGADFGGRAHAHSGPAEILLAQKFTVMWGCFGLVALGAGVTQWLVVALVERQLTEFKPVLFSAMLSTLLFLVALPLYLINRAMDSRDIFRS